MRPAGLVAVCNEIVHGARTRIVECGSGVSTVVLARLLRERHAGALVALEHDRHWAALVRDHLRREALDDDRPRASTRLCRASRRGTGWLDWTRFPTRSTCSSSTARQRAIPVTARAARRRCRGSSSGLSLAQRSCSTTSAALASARSSYAGRRRPTGASSSTSAPEWPSVAVILLTSSNPYPGFRTKLLRRPSRGLATIRKNGPQLSNVLYTWDQELLTVRVSATAGRAKTRNLRARPPRLPLHSRFALLGLRGHRGRCGAHRSDDHTGR